MVESMLEEEIKKIFKILEEEKIPYFVVGGVALVLYGIPRTTIDLDIFIPAKKDISTKLIEVFEKNGFLCKEKGIEKIEEKFLPSQWITFIEKDGREILDVFLQEEKEFFEKYKETKKIQQNDIEIYVASLSFLKELKSKSGREIDKIDLKLIEEIEKREL